MKKQESPAFRRESVNITEDPETRSAINAWLDRGANAWRKAFEQVSPEQRAMFVRTIEAYEAETSGTVD